MDCPRCGTPPTSGDRFCRECGGYLSTTPSFDDLEPPGSAHADEETPVYGMGDAVQFSGPAVPAIEDDPQPPPYPGGQPTMEGWGQPATHSWYEEGQAADPTWSGQPAYDPPAYDHGGPVPFDEPGYAAPDYPGGESAEKRRNGLLVMLAVLAVIVLVTVGAVVVITGGDGEETAGADDSPSPMASSSSTSSSPSPTESGSTPEAQAKAVDELLSRAAGGKSLLTTAYDQAVNCEISPAAAEQKFEDAAQNRRDIVASARKLDTTKIDSGPRIKSLMISMYGTSAKADDAFAAWARAGAADGDSCLKENAKRKKGNSLSIKAGKTKQQFVRAWNPVAEQYGHTKRTKAGL